MPLPAMTHSSAFLLPASTPPSNDAATTTYALVVLNQRLPRFAPLIWARARVRVCADGGANRVFDGMPELLPGEDPAEVRSRYKPDVIKGDMDSIRPEVKEYYSNSGTNIVDESHDQDTTDLHKCVSFITRDLPVSDKSNLCILVLGALGGRFDHEMGNINVLYRFSNTKIVLLSDDCSIFLLPKTYTHEIHIEKSVEGPHCGLIPIGGPSTSTTTTGLRWNLVGKEVDGIEDSVIFRSLQALAVPLIGNACYVFMHGLNSVQIYGAEKLHQALQERPKGKPLLTVSNHVAAMDDPFVIASLLPPSIMLEAQKLRWTLCATDRCFTNPVLSTFFRSVKVLPVSRGDGIYQKGMDMALSKLNSGGWVHIFPEGSRSRDGGKTIAPAKRGVGRLVMDTDSLPVVIPFVHTGMQDIMPVGKRIPRAGKRVIVVVGDPINFDDLIIDNSDDTQHTSRGILYDKATQRIGQRLQELKVEVDRLAAEQQSELQNHNIHNVSDDGYRLWQQVDWEGFGIGNSMLSSEPSAVQEQSKEAEPELRLEVEQSVSPAPSDVAVPNWFQRHVDPSELMGFAARGLIKNGKLEEGYRELQEPTTLNTWWWSQANNAVPRWSIA
ncbi:uncharacterized protein LOC101768024 [Setaria italica]|uniref:uncharacterized protein LOC101768024 n=1 Tax=Setaria italica TaxID=4555 RepID=UPI0006472E27|nr:uncharacterized protein LOC101768024 [Setaria italica]